jgi:hypothetical protein
MDEITFLVMLTPFFAVAALMVAWLVAGVAIDPDEGEDDPHKDPEHWGRS